MDLGLSGKTALVLGGGGAFLASECASYVTGSVVRVDGGLIPSV